MKSHEATKSTQSTQIAALNMNERFSPDLSALNGLHHSVIVSILDNAKKKK